MHLDVKLSWRQYSNYDLLCGNFIEVCYIVPLFEERRPRRHHIAVKTDQNPTGGAL